MLVKASITTTREVERDVELPFFAKNKQNGSYFRINEDNTILRVDLLKDYKEEKIIYGGMCLQRERIGLISEIVGYEPSTEEEFEEVTRTVLAYMDEKIQSFA